MRYLLFVNLLIVCSFPATTVSENPELMQDGKRNDFRIIITTPQAEITGICVVKNVNGEWRGTIMNEFGIKVFDFICTSKKCKLLNVISFIDKWYIKKVVASDIQFIMEIDNPDYKIGAKSDRYWVQDTLTVMYKKEKELKRFPSGEVVCKNNRRAIAYSLKKMNETER